jgi:C4-dicarboxylate transporter DctM subunit
MEMAILFGSMLVLIIIGMPIGYAVGVATVLTIVTSSSIPLTMVAQLSISGVNSFPLMAIPFFILAGLLMTHGGIAKRLIMFFDVFVGRITGGLGMVAIVTSMFFGAITGSAMATASAVGSFMLPEMTKRKYDVSFSSSLVAAAGTIGIIIPPSIPFVIYGVVTSTSIGDLFIAGIIPGILMGVALMITCYIIARKRGYRGSETRYTFKTAWSNISSAFLALLSPVIVLGGIYSGIFTPTEAAVVSVVYSLVIGLFVYKELNPKNIYRALYDTMVINGITVFMVGLSSGFAAYLSISQIPVKIAKGILTLSDNPIIILLIINFFLLIVGCLIDNIPATIILSPILLPVVVQCGLTPITFGVVLTLNLAIGFCTPPYGPNLFVIAAIAKVPVASLFKTIIPFILSLIVVLLLVTYVPWITMVLL